MHQQMLLASSAYAPPATDPYWANVASMLHFDGSYADQKPNTWSPTGSPSITALSKFGSGALLLADGDYISTTAGTEFQFGTGDFTIEAWVSPTKSGGSFGNAFFYDAGINTANGFSCSLNGAGLLEVRTTTGNKLNVATGLKSAGYGFMSICRVGNTIYIGDNGIVSAHSFSGVNVTHSGALNIGFPATFGYAGRMDELRITKGIARYTSNYTPPAAPFPDS